MTEAGKQLIRASKEARNMLHSEADGTEVCEWPNCNCYEPMRPARKRKLKRAQTEGLTE